MDLSLSETQQLIQESARDFVRNDCAKDKLAEFDKQQAPVDSELWRKMAQLSWMGMVIPEEYGGTGNTMTDVAVLVEELGRGPVPGPMLSSAVLGASILLEAGSADQKKSWLPEVATGDRILALAATEAQYGWSANHIQMTARRQGGDYILTGTKLFVQDAASATDLLVLVRAEDGDGISLLRVDAASPGVSIRPLAGFITGAAEVKFEDARVGGDDLIGEAGAAWPALGRAMQPAIPILCAYKVGGCQAVFEMSVEYSRERTQFGQPIGRFQRVQDHIVHIVNHLDAARWTAYEALWKLDSGRDAASSVHMAKAVASESYMIACDYGHEVHAGIGVVREYGLTLHTKMSRTLYHFLGAPKEHRKLLEPLLKLAPA